MRPFFLILLLIVTLAGCNGGDASKKEDGGAQNYDTGLKDLKKEDIVVGKGSEWPTGQQTVAVGDRVYVRYTGTFSDGKEFDTNDPKKKENAEPFGFMVGNREVIQGWDKGLIGMKVGGKRKLSVPWSQGYGAAGSSNIPPKSDLFFEVELLDIVKEKDAQYFDTIDVTKGTGLEVADGKKVTVEYEVTISGGKLVEKSSDVGGPTTFVYGKRQAHRTFEMALKGMKQGGVRKVRMPPAIGFTMSEASHMPGLMVSYATVKLLKVE